MGNEDEILQSSDNDLPPFVRVEIVMQVMLNVK